MATKYDRAKLKTQKEFDQALVEQLTIIAEQSAAITLTYADDDGNIPTDRKTRQQIVDEIWDEILKPYYIGAGTEPFTGADPQSPYAQHVYDGILAVTEITAEEQIDIIDKYTKDDPTVNNWLKRENPNSPLQISEMLIAEQIPGQPTYDPFHLFVYGDSPYRLSDRVWNTAIDVRDNIDQMLLYEIPRGKSAVDIANQLQIYLTPAGAKPKTKKPYGTEGSYSARRLSRTEITAAAGRSTLNASALNPYVIGDQWVLSASHPEPDQCDANANGGANNDGIYPIGEFPSYPDHPHELCTIIPAITDEPASVTADLRAQIDAQFAGELSASESNEINALQGAFNFDTLVQLLVLGWFIKEQTN